MTDYVTTYYVKAGRGHKWRDGELQLLHQSQVHRLQQRPLSVHQPGILRFHPGRRLDLVLLGATYKTLGHAPVMTDGNFAAATNGTVTVVMPKGHWK